MTPEKLNELKKTANNVRLSILEAVYNASSGHPGGSLSVADILTYLYFEEMNIDPKNPKDENRDRFVLSKGHTSPALYSVLAERGYFPKEDIKTFRRIDSYLQGHPDMKHIPGVDMSSGSLGQGMSAACGMALSAKISGKDYRVYAALGDGEIQEGQIWEASMFAAHDFEQIEAAYQKARATKGKPFAIVAKTVKGKGVSFMENQASWHGTAPNQEQYEMAVKELTAAK